MTSLLGTAARRRGITSVLRDVFRYRLFVPAHLRIYLEDTWNVRRSDASSRESLDAAMQWLARAQDVAGGGVAAYYSFASGWSAPYAETTGYIVCTMFDYYRLTKLEAYRDRAIRMSDWELKMQLPDGAFPGGHSGPSARPIVFNTGQVLQGLVRAYIETKDERYRSAARKAGDWLADIQEPDGSWRRHTYRDTVHTYHTRVAWPLHQLYQISGDERHAKAADMNLHWALGMQQPNGWFRNNALYLQTDHALTHSIAYAIEGLLEAGILTSNKSYVAAARKASDVVLEIFRSTGGLQASYDGQWTSPDGYACVTGNAQMAIVWLRLFEITQDERYARAALDMNAMVRALQNTTSSHAGIRGGIKGSDPICGGYMPMCYLNWATKFFADALILEARLRQAMALVS
jgi:uncharacterized protein YyaL (SSP411 family)